MKENQPQEGGDSSQERKGDWPVEGESQFPVFEAVPSKSGRGRRRRGGGLRGRERREKSSVGKRETSASRGGVDPTESLKGSSKGSRSSSVPPLEGRAKVNSWSEAGERFQVFEAVPGSRRESRSDSGRGRAARLEPINGPVDSTNGPPTEGTWPQTGNATFPVYPAVPAVDEADGAVKGFQVFEAVPGKDERSN